MALLSEFTAPGVQASSALNYRQMNEFFYEMKKTVCKIHVERKLRRSIKHEFYTGVCIRPSGLILTCFFDDKNLSKIEVQFLNEKHIAQLVHHNIESGLALLLAKHVNSYNHIKFAYETTFNAGRHVYGIVYPRKASSSVLLMGHLAYHCDPKSESSRKVNNLPEGVYPVGFNSPFPLLQIARMGASNENQSREGYNSLNKFGLEEGRGSPVFDATGHLIGLVAFQQAGFDFAIHVKEFREFLSRYPSLDGVGPSSSKGTQKVKV